MPFVTEELWQRLPRRPDQASAPSIMRARYPAAHAAWKDASAEADMELVLAVVGRVRGLRSGMLPWQNLLWVACTHRSAAAWATGATVHASTAEHARQQRLLFSLNRRGPSATL